MFGKKELEITVKVCEARMHDLLEGDRKCTDEEYIRDLQTLIQLKGSAEDKMDKAI